MDLMTSANRAPALPVMPLPVTPMLINSAMLTCTAEAGECHDGTTLFALVPSAAHGVRVYTAAAGRTTIHNSIMKTAGVGHPPRGNPL